MFEDKYIYVVHSDTDENNIYMEFVDEAEALDYAKAHIDEQTYVERVYCEADVESGEIVDVYETEVIWDYASEDLNEFLDAKVNVDFDGGDNNDVRVLSSFDPETDGEPLDEFLDADINLSIDGGTSNNVKVLDKGLVEGINLKNDTEREEFFRLCDEIGIYTANDIINFKKEMDCTDENILQALRDYRAELGPDFKIADPELEKEMAKKYAMKESTEEPK